ncbi:MAG: endonuclease III [Bacteroidia bacterium]|nr:endonuclease III [Bacteroidia bacterium]
MTRKERFAKVLAFFQQHQPQAETELIYTNPFELLVAVVLSAQCTDKRVNLTTPKLFERFPDADSLSKAEVSEVFDLIRSISYPNNKAKHLVQMAQMLVKDFNNTIPSDVETLVKLPGVGRKTANVIASVVFDQPTLAVDTHVFRVSARIGLSKGAKNPLQTEKQLLEYIPESLVAISHHWLILHGRYVCTARNPNCMNCPLQDCCQYFEKNLAKK